MSITTRKLMNPLRNISEPTTSDARCICGKGVQFNENGIKPHRAKIDSDKSRKQRKSGWCCIPAMIQKYAVTDAGCI